MKTAAVALAVVAVASFSAAGPREANLQKVLADVAATARRQGFSDTDVRRAVSVLERLAETGMPASHAAEVVRSAIRATGSAAEIEAVAASVDRAYRQGAASQELVNLVSDLAESRVGGPGFVTAIEAVGRLAEDGYTDSETRRGVTLTALAAMADGLRGEALAETIRDQAHDQNDASRPSAPDAGTGKGRGEAATEDQSLRDDLREHPPLDLPSRGPATNPGRGGGSGDEGPGQGQGPPDGSPGNGPPGNGSPGNGSPGNGPPSDIPGKGPPEGTPGKGPPDSVPGNGPPDRVPGKGPPDNPGGGKR